jgi:hypothetical protein
MHVRFAIVLLAAAFPGSYSTTNAQGPESARQFLSNVYQHYGKNGHGVNLTGKSGRKVFASSLRSLARQDISVNGSHQVGVLDGDPVCACQDWDAIHDLSIDLQPVDANHSRAHVSFSLSAGKDRRNLDFELVRERGTWRIWNIVDHSDPKAAFDLRAELEKDIRQVLQNGKRRPGY